MIQRMVVIGGDAAAMSAASQAKRLAGDKLEVVAFERGAHSSYSACGIPYWVAGDVPDGEQLAVRDLAAGRRYRESFDHLVLATAVVIGGGYVGGGDGRGDGPPAGGGDGRGPRVPADEHTGSRHADAGARPRATPPTPGSAM